MNRSGEYEASNCHIAMIIMKSLLIYRVTEEA